MALLVALVGLPVLYTISVGYTTVFLSRPRAEVSVNGQLVKGSVHESRRALIITRRDVAHRHSYFVIVGQGRNPILDCGTWVAPRFPILLSNHQSPLCASWALDPVAQRASDSPAGDASVKAEEVEFRTQKGDVIEARP